MVARVRLKAPQGVTTKDRQDRESMAHAVLCPERSPAPEFIGPDPETVILLNNFKYEVLFRKNNFKVKG